jgi:hypothetical protein
VTTVVSALLDDLWPLLGRTPDLAKSHGEGDSEFPAQLRAWIEAGEAVLRKHRQPQLAELAGLRAQLQAAAVGVFDAQSLRLPPTSGTRKVRRAAAALLFNRAQAVLAGVHDVFSARREEAAKFLRQMIAMSLQKGSFHPAWNGGADRGASISRLWQTLMADPDSQAAARHLLSLVSYPDALRLIDETAAAWGL